MLRAKSGNFYVKKIENGVNEGFGGIWFFLSALSLLSHEEVSHLFVQVIQLT
jgi:hypothetical protein